MRRLTDRHGLQESGTDPVTAARSEGPLLLLGPMEPPWFLYFVQPGGLFSCKVHWFPYNRFSFVVNSVFLVLATPSLT